MTIVNLIPAYGVIYPSKKEVIKAWGNGKLFYWSKLGYHISIKMQSTLKAYNYTEINIPYGKSGLIASIKL